MDYFNGKKVAFWHVQTDVIHYLQCVRRRGFMSRISRYKSHFSEQSGEHLFWRAYDRFFLTGQTRLEVYKYYFESNDFSGVLNEKTYWKDNIFR